MIEKEKIELEEIKEEEKEEEVDDNFDIDWGGLNSFSLISFVHYFSHNIIFY